MMPGIDASGCGLAIVLLMIAITCIVINVAALVWLASGRSSAPAGGKAEWPAGWSAVTAVGALSFLVFASFLILRLAAHDILSSWIVAIFALPAGLGLASIAAVLLAARRVRLRGWGVRLCAALFVAGLCASGYVGLRWRAMALRGALWDAVVREEVAMAAGLLARGAGGEPADRPFRQRLLVMSARDVNLALARALLDAGADPNGADGDLLPLPAAIGANPNLRLHPIDPETHARHRLQVVTLLLERGADPNPAVAEGMQTPARLAWAAGNGELLQLLEANGSAEAARYRRRLEACATCDRTQPPLPLPSQPVP